MSHIIVYVPEPDDPLKDYPTIAELVAEGQRKTSNDIVQRSGKRRIHPRDHSTSRIIQHDYYGRWD